MPFAMRGILCFILVVAACLVASQGCDQECRLVQMEQIIAQQTEVLRLILQNTKEAVATMKAIQGDTRSMEFWLKWK